MLTEKIKDQIFAVRDSGAAFGAGKKSRERVRKGN